MPSLAITLYIAHCPAIRVGRTFAELPLCETEKALLRSRFVEARISHIRKRALQARAVHGQVNFQLAGSKEAGGKGVWENLQGKSETDGSKALHHIRNTLDFQQLELVIEIICGYFTTNAPSKLIEFYNCMLRSVETSARSMLFL